MVGCLGLCEGSLTPPLLANFRGAPLLFFLCFGRCCFWWWPFGSIFLVFFFSLWFCFCVVFGASLGISFLALPLGGVFPGFFLDRPLMAL